MSPRTGPARLGTAPSPGPGAARGRTARPPGGKRGTAMSAGGTPATAQPTVRQPTVAEVMRPPTTTVETRAPLAAAAYLMKRSKDNALVVVTDDVTRRPLGVI